MKVTYTSQLAHFFPNRREIVLSVVQCQTETCEWTVYIQLKIQYKKQPKTRCVCATPCPQQGHRVKVTGHKVNNDLKVLDPYNILNQNTVHSVNGKLEAGLKIVDR